MIYCCFSEAQKCDTMVSLCKRLSGAGSKSPSAQFLWHSLLKRKVLNNCWAHICHHWNNHSTVCLTETSKIPTGYKKKIKSRRSESLSLIINLLHKNIPRLLVLEPCNALSDHRYKHFLGMLCNYSSRGRPTGQSGVLHFHSRRVAGGCRVSTEPLHMLLPSSMFSMLKRMHNLQPA